METHCTTTVADRKTSINGFAEKVCEPNGTWHHYHKFRLHSNYTTCVDVDQYRWENTVVLLYQIGYVISLIALLVALFIYGYFKSLRCPRITIHINLFLSFAICNAMWLVFYQTIVGNPYLLLTNGIYCRALHVVLYYFMMASYMWMLCEGFYLHTILVCAFTNEHALVKCLMVYGWLSPAPILTLYAVMRATSNNEADYGYCWTDNGNYFKIMLYPVAASLGLNFIFLVNIIRVIVMKFRRGPGVVQPSLGLRQAVRATVLLVPLLGLHYLATPFRPPYKHPWEWVYDIVAVVTASYQGLAVAILFCFCNGEVIAQFKRRWEGSSLRTRANSCTATTVSFVRSTAGQVQV